MDHFIETVPKFSLIFVASLENVTGTENQVVCLEVLTAVRSELVLSCLCRLLAVPLPVGDCVFSLSWLLPTYFLFAVTYDVLQSLADVAHYLPLYSHSPEPHDRNLTVSLTAANLSTLL